MNQYTYLIGAEEAQNAAKSMRESVRELQHANCNMVADLERHQQWADAWLQTFEKLLSNRHDD